MVLGLLDPPAPSGPASSASGALLLVVPFVGQGKRREMLVPLIVFKFVLLLRDDDDDDDDEADAYEDFYSFGEGCN